MAKDAENQRLRATIAHLESKVDHLESELGFLQGMLVDLGFNEGIETLKMAGSEMLENGHLYPLPKAE